MLQVSGLYIYPIKSLQGIAVSQARVTAKGFEHDRCWMLVDAHNRFISQRQVPAMVLLQVAIVTDGLLVTHKISDEKLFIEFKTSPLTSPVDVTIWDDTCTAQHVSHRADKWFTAMLGINCRLVHMPDGYKRLADQRYAHQGAVTSFADGYPFLIIGQASLDDLNSRLTQPLPINRFRPNIVFTGGKPYQEDLMGNFTIAGINFYGVKLCARCVITTINQNNGTIGNEPLKTLAGYRKKNNKIYFGQNLVHTGNGTIAIGNQLQTISLNHQERFIINMPAENPGR